MSRAALGRGNRSLEIAKGVTVAVAAIAIERITMLSRTRRVRPVIVAANLQN